MSSFRVNWLHDARIEVAELWVISSDPPSIRNAVDAIDEQLAASSGACGEHMSEGLFRFAFGPLSVSYSINAEQRVIEVSWVRLTRA
jgi:hypothetical protein